MTIMTNISPYKLEKHSDIMHILNYNLFEVHILRYIYLRKCDVRWSLLLVALGSTF